LLGLPDGRIPTPLQQAAALLGAPEPPLCAALRLFPLVARGLRSSAPLGLLSLPTHDSPLLAAQGLQHPSMAPSCSANALSGFHHCQTTPALRSFVVERFGHHQARCRPICVQWSLQFFSFFGPAHLPLVFSLGSSPIPGMDYPMRCSAPRLRAIAAAGCLLLLANRLSACLKSILPYPANGSLHK